MLKVPVLISSLVAGIFFIACNSTRNDSRDIESRRHGDSVYTCPMHPEITGKKGDKCPKCGMDLIAAPDEQPATVKVALTTSPQVIEAGKPARLTFTFKENGHDVPLDISHEMKIHLMVVDENLTRFRHIHPREQTDSSYTISETFPDGGNYFLFTDFKPQGVAPTVDKKEITIKGNPGSNKPDFSTRLVTVVDGYTVRLENGNDLKTNRTQPLEITVEKDGRLLAENDIEPYLGATAHIAMIEKEDKDFVHIHPVSGKRFPIYAETYIKKPGIHRIWVEFQIKGKVRTAAFTVNVSEGRETMGSQSHNGHPH